MSTTPEQPDATAPSSADPTSSPEHVATEPDAGQPDAAEPFVTEPIATEPDAAQPDSTQPDSTQPDSTQPANPEPANPWGAPPPPPPSGSFGADNPNPWDGTTPAPPTVPPQMPPAQAPPPPVNYGAAPAYGTTGAVAPLSPQEEKTWSLGAHLGVLILGFLAPLIIWLVFKGRGPFLEHHAKESLNFQITVMIASVVSAILTLAIVGIFMFLVLVPWMVVMPILAAVKSNNGEWYRYPLTLRLVK